MATNFKNLPEMRDDLLYEDWKLELEIWCSFTDLDKKRKGPAIFLTLKVKARETILAEVKPADLTGDNGVTKITDALDKLYVKNKSENAYTAFENFSKFKRPSNMSIEDYMIEFNLRLCKIRSHKMDLPEGVLAFYLLDCVNLPKDQTALCRATCPDLTYDNMKTQIERVYSSKQPTATNDSQISVEPQFVTDHDDYYYEEEYADEVEADETEDAYYSQPNPHPRSYQSRTGQYANREDKAKKNPLDEFGNHTPCRFCKSIFHWVDQCPDAPISAKRGMRGSSYARRNIRYPTRSRGRGNSSRGYATQRQF